MDFSNQNAGKNLSSSDRQALISDIKQQIEVANAQELLQQVNERCFKLCVQKPSSSLSSSEQVSIILIKLVILKIASLLKNYPLILRNA
jgi:mitochondrial import inner membrane translocase subunit TIM13